MPNADAGGQAIATRIEEFVSRDPHKQWTRDNLGTQRYFSLMANAAAMVGNSSSGISEAPFFHLLVVNVGTRHAGRTRAANVVDVGYEVDDILAGIHRATSPAFREHVRLSPNPFGQSNTSAIITSILRQVTIDDRLLKKESHDL